MDFNSRGQIAKAVALGSLRGRLNYNATLCASANYFFKQVFKKNDIDDFEEVELIEPQKAGIIRSTGARAALSAIVYFIIKMVCRNVEFEQPLLVNVCAMAGAFVAFLLLDMTLGRPGGLTAKENDRSFYSRKAEAADTPVKKKRYPGRKKMMAFQIGWRVAIVLLIIGTLIWSLWPETVAEYWGIDQSENKIVSINVEKYNPQKDELQTAEFTEAEDIEKILAILQETKCRKLKMDDSDIGLQDGFIINIQTEGGENYIMQAEENKFLAMNPAGEQMENSGDNLLTDYLFQQEFRITEPVNEEAEKGATP